MVRYYLHDDCIDWPGYESSKYKQFSTKEDFDDSLRFNYEYAESEGDEFEETLEEVLDMFESEEDVDFSCNGFTYIKLTNMSLAEFECDDTIDEDSLEQI